MQSNYVHYKDIRKPISFISLKGGNDIFDTKTLTFAITISNCSRWVINLLFRIELRERVDFTQQILALLLGHHSQLVSHKICSHFAISWGFVYLVKQSLIRWPIRAKHNSFSVLKHNNLLKNTTIFWTTQQSFSEHNNLFENTTIFLRTQQSFREHNNRVGNTTIFSRTQGIFLVHNKLFQNTIKFSDTQTQTKTQQNLAKHNKISKHW